MVCACASWVGVPRCVMGAVAAGAAVDVAAALAPMPPLVPPPARLLTPPLVPLARARVVSWVDYRSLSRWASPRPVAFPKQFGNYPARRRRLRALWQRRWEGKQTALTACGCAPIRSLRRFSAIAVSRLRHFGPSGYAALSDCHSSIKLTEERPPVVTSGHCAIGVTFFRFVRRPPLSPADTEMQWQALAKSAHGFRALQCRNHPTVS